MNNFKLKYHSHLMMADLFLNFVNITSIWCFLILGQVYKFLVLGVDAHFLYANKAAGLILPAIWNEQIWPMVWKIPIMILIDAGIRAFIRYQRES
jgi:hypothetical protein